jgi:hypothetical protein
VELVYEGEQEGAAAVAQNLLGAAIKTFFLAISRSKKNWKNQMRKQHIQI